jgi:hypothetical protein
MSWPLQSTWMEELDPGQNTATRMEQLALGNQTPNWLEELNPGQNTPTWMEELDPGHHTLLSGPPLAVHQSGSKSAIGYFITIVYLYYYMYILCTAGVLYSKVQDTILRFLSGIRHF